MTDTPDHFASADRLITTARAAAEEERKKFEQRIFELETELKLTQASAERACTAREDAMRTTAKLLTQFGIVAQVFEDARKVAIEAGLYTASGSEKAAPDSSDDVDSERG